MTDLRIELLDRFRTFDRNGLEITVAGAKTRALLANLALTIGRPQRRDRLAELLWSGRFQTQARQSLRQSLRALRKSLGEAASVVVIDGAHIALDDTRVEVDTREAELDIAAGRYARAAAVLSVNCPLSDIDLPDQAFSQWLNEERKRLHSLACAALERLAEQNRELGCFDDAIAAGRKLVALDPLRDDSHQLLMRLYAEAGRGIEAVREPSHCADSLRVNLGAEPDPRIIVRRHQIGQVVYYTGPDGHNALSAPAAQTVGSVHGLPCIAVLPFTNLGTPDTAEGFAQSLVEDLATELARFHWLSVSARHTGVRNGGGSVDFERVGRELRARYLVTGSVRTVDERVRVLAKLIDAADGIYLWSERYDFTARDRYVRQDELISSIVASIEPALAMAERRRSRRKPPWELNAWDHYNQGVWHLFHFSQDDIAEARRSFRRAIRNDPDFAAPHVGLAYACRLSLIFDYAESPADTLDEALEAGRRAVFLDDQDFFAHTILGRLHLIAGEHDSAISETRIAVDRNPNSAQAHFGLGLALTMTGDARQAMEPLTKAVELSPHDPNLSSYASLLSTSHILLRDYKKAFSWARVATRQPSSHFIAQMHIVAALGMLGDRNAAAKARAKLLSLKPDFSLDYVVRAWPFKHRSDTAKFLHGLRNAGISD